LRLLVAPGDRDDRRYQDEAWREVSGNAHTDHVNQLESVRALTTSSLPHRGSCEPRRIASSPPRLFYTSISGPHLRIEPRRAPRTHGRVDPAGISCVEPGPLAVLVGVLALGRPLAAAMAARIRWTVPNPPEGTCDAST
jgi:hypothetical protein